MDDAERGEAALHSRPVPALVCKFGERQGVWFGKEAGHRILDDGDGRGETMV